ncbi:kinase-like domain-containing protein [Coemansia mojavensis]|nr:kinase-like domain-containing protein [Coemansia mojavensis]
MDTTNANMPTTLRHFLARGTNSQHDLHPNHGTSAAYAAATTLQNPPSSRLSSAKSMGNLRSGSALGAWLSKYHLRPSGTRPTSVSADYALSAFITSVETREASSTNSLGEHRVSSLRMGRKRYLVYRILWWFYELYQHLRRQFPQRAHLWGEFPSKRLLPGLSSSADSVMQRRERLNDPEQFLRDDPLDADSVPLAEREAGEKEASMRRNFGGIVPLAAQQQTKRSVSSGSGLTELKMPWQDDSGKWAPPMPTAPKTRESLERMASMPALKSANKPTFDFSAPLPTQPFSATSANDSVNQKAQGPVSMIRKTSDPLEYASAEKRPNPVAPQTMRKKYGFRRNMQYRSDRYDGKNRGASSSQPQIPLPPPPDTGATLMEPHLSHGTMNWESDYVIVDDDVGADAMELDSTLRAGSVDSEIDASTRSVQSAKRGRKLAVLRRAALGGIGKPLNASADSVNRMVSAPPSNGSKRQHTLEIEAEAADDIDDVNSHSSKPATQSKVSLDDFQLLSIIGKGSYGQVMLARYKDSGKVMAIKVISKSKLRGRPNEIRRVMSERKVLERTVRHPFLVGLQCAFQTKEKLFFCLDYVNGGELFFHLQRERRFGENRARFYAAEIISALAYLHGMDVVYRDLKPENCLLDARGHVRIVDFGLAKEVGPVVWRTEGSALYSVEVGGKTGTFCGTPEYLAPEVLLRQRYGKEVDWYCLGAVLFEMLTGLPPFYHQDNNTMYQRILSEDLKFPANLPPSAPCNGTLQPGSGNVASNVIGRYAQDFVFRIMERDPKNRLGHGVFGTENVKRHVFFHGIDWGKIYRQEYAPPFVPKVSSIFDLSNIDPEFRNEPIPESILSEGQVDIIAEAAEAERQAELEMHSQLLAFPSPMKSPKGPTSLRAQDADVDSTINAFRGFSFVSPYVDAPDSD